MAFEVCVISCCPHPCPHNLGSTKAWGRRVGDREDQGTENCRAAILPHWSLLHFCKDISGIAGSQRFGDTEETQMTLENLLWLLCMGTSEAQVWDVSCLQQSLSRDMACRGQGSDESLGRVWKQQLLLAGRRRAGEVCDSQSPIPREAHGPWPAPSSCRGWPWPTAISSLCVFFPLVLCSSRGQNVLGIDCSDRFSSHPRLILKTMSLGLFCYGNGLGVVQFSLAVMPTWYLLHYL